MDQNAILADYRELRSKSLQVNSRLVETLHRDDVLAAASALGIARGNKIDLETEDELSVVMDYAIHNCLHDGKNAVDRLLDEHPYLEGSVELRLLSTMQQSHFTLFEVSTPLPGFGVRGFDGPKKTPTLIVDLGFSTTASPGMALATRIFSPGEGWWMTTGAALPLNDESLDRIIRDFDQYTQRHGHEPEEERRELIIRRACIAAGASRRIRYADIGDTSTRERPTAPIQRAPRIGRNDPCPCGSGKKYKKCCGG